MTIREKVLFFIGIYAVGLATFAILWAAQNNRELFLGIILFTIGVPATGFVTIMLLWGLGMMLGIVDE